MTHALRTAAFVLLLSSACSQTPVSHGANDAGVDAGAPDAGSPDAGAPDAGPLEATVPDTYVVTIAAPPGGEVFAVPLGMTPDGTVVGYAGDEAWGPLSRPVRVPRGSSAEFLAVPEENFGFAYCGSASGVIAGTFAQEPKVWDSTGMHPLTVPDGFFSGAARGVAADGTIVGSFADSDDALPPNPIGPRPMAWVGPSRSFQHLRLLDPAFINGAAFAVNPQGQIAGALDSENGYVAVRWEDVNALPEPLNPAEGAQLSEGAAISTAGDVAGRVTLSDNSSRAFRAMVGQDPEVLPPLSSGNGYSEGKGINKWGHVVGTANAGPGEAHAVLWDGTQAIDLNDRVTLPTNVRYLSSAVAIDDEGWIAAEAVMTEGFGDSVRNIAILAPVR